MNGNLLLYEPCLHMYMVCIMITTLIETLKPGIEFRETFVEI